MPPPSPTRTSSGNQQSTSAADAALVDGNVRKRVCKACDRCRLKKSKCDGGNPCGRCKSDDAICFFGERKRSTKVYPKGYVEMLEQQQAQIVAGLQELYRRITEGECWPGPVLDDGGSGQPRVHDILDALGVLKQDRHGISAAFEEDFNVLQRRLYESGAPPMLRDRSMSLDSEMEMDESSTVADLASSVLPPTTNTNPPPRRVHLPPTPPSGSELPMAPHPFVAHMTAQLPTPGAEEMMQMDLNTMMQTAWNANARANANAMADDNMDFLHRFQSPTSHEPPVLLSQDQNAPVTNNNGGPSLGQEWNEDEEFTALFNRVVA
ncbi:MAG: hypothetical protein M1823_006068 [Watsoniomyces obsoletus]|nr:MAG: hypothetical protein M1823_006068 [Watsoniomyces obsoletus]